MVSIGQIIIIIIIIIIVIIVIIIIIIVTYVLPGDCWAFVHEQLKNTLKISTFFIMPRAKQWRLYRPRGTDTGPHAHAQLFCYIIQGRTGKSSEQHSLTG